MTGQSFYSVTVNSLLPLRIFNIYPNYEIHSPDSEVRLMSWKGNVSTNGGFSSNGNFQHLRLARDASRTVYGLVIGCLTPSFEGLVKEKLSKESIHRHPKG